MLEVYAGVKQKDYRLGIRIALQELPWSATKPCKSSSAETLAFALHASASDDVDARIHADHAVCFYLRIALRQ